MNVMNELLLQQQSCFGWIKRLSCHENNWASCEHILSIVRGSCFTTESRAKRPYNDTFPCSKIWMDK